MALPAAAATVAAAICANMTPPVTDAAAIAAWTVAVNQIYLGIVANAVVNVASVSGVTAGAVASGPGLGSIA